MKVLSEAELLAVWERGAALLPLERTLILVEAAFPEKSVAALVELTIGQRDSYLLTLREVLFGPEMICLAECPKCRENVEMAFKATDIRTDAGVKQKQNDILSFERSGYEVRFRLPNSSDLAAIAGSRDIAVARRMLLMRCLLSACQNGIEMAVDQLPQDILESLVDEMTRSDPLADVRLTLLCPSCGQRWQVVFDIVSFLWSEIDAWAHRTLREVHVLASSYGWSESDILALSPWRRRLYLDMVGE